MNLRRTYVYLYMALSLYDVRGRLIDNKNKVVANNNFVEFSKGHEGYAWKAQRKLGFIVHIFNYKTFEVQRTLQNFNLITWLIGR